MNLFFLLDSMSSKRTKLDSEKIKDKSVPSIGKTCTKENDDLQQRFDDLNVCFIF